ncbi:MAG TPA: hypothetical protein VKQ36_15320, partial [Ktedonobacterales bacterium]|nr:hypothetical protein [Ktedonobacterales bacterium]
IANKGKNTQKGTHSMSVSTSRSEIPAPVSLHPPRRRFAGLVASAATLLIVALLAATLAYALHARQNTPASQNHHNSTPVATATQPPAPITITPHTPIQGSIVLSPSDPQIVYLTTNFNKQTPNQEGEILRSSDGGKTYTQLPTPPTTLTSGPQFSIIVSPFNADHVIATASAYQTCPAAGAPPNRTPHSTQLSQLTQLSGVGPCSQGFYSNDGGQTWLALNMPFAGGVLGATSAEEVFTGIVQAQGSRLYSLAGISSNNNVLTQLSGIRIVGSSDDGVSWHAVDTGLRGTVCDFAAAPTGSTLYAIMYPGIGVPNANCVATNGQALTLWRSEDAGAGWTKVFTFTAEMQPQNYAETLELGMRVAANGVLYINMPALDQSGQPDLSPTAIMVSQDGGRTFTRSPATGAPAMPYFQNPEGTLSDGSVLIESIQGQTPSNDGQGTLYAWHPGETSWWQVSRRFPNPIFAVMVIPHDGKDTIYLAQSSGQISHFTISA